MKTNNEVKTLQNLINELFTSTLIKKEDKFRLSYPLIPRISDNYLKNRVVVVGQETNTWFDSGSESGDYNSIFLNTKNDIETKALIERYDFFIKDYIQNYGGKFWTFNRYLYDKNIIKGKMVENDKLAHCWINIFLMEACRDKQDKDGSPTRNRELKEAVLRHQGMLVYHLLKILSPKLIIFLTGPSLDGIVCKHALNIEDKDFKTIDMNNILQTKHACQILTDKRSCFFDTTILRLYHPSYFMWQINGYESLKDKINKERGEDVISYYQSVVFSFLQHWKNNAGESKKGASPDRYSDALHNCR